MANKSTIRITSVNRPQLVFTPAVTRDDLARLHSEPTRLEESAIKSLQYIEEENQSAKTRRAKALVMPKADQRWSFHHTLARTIHGDRDLAPGRRHRNRTRSRTTGNEQWAAAGTSQPRVAGWLSAEWT